MFDWFHASSVGNTVIYHLFDNYHFTCYFSILYLFSRERFTYKDTLPYKNVNIGLSTAISTFSHK